MFRGFSLYISIIAGRNIEASCELKSLKRRVCAVHGRARGQKSTSYFYKSGWLFPFFSFICLTLKEKQKMVVWFPFFRHQLQGSPWLMTELLELLLLKFHKCSFVKWVIYQYKKKNMTANRTVLVGSGQILQGVFLNFKVLELYLM